MKRYIDLDGKKRTSLARDLCLRESADNYWKIFNDLNLQCGDTLNIAIPQYPDSLTRSVLTNYLNNHYGISDIFILPRPLALLVGFLAKHHELDNPGNFICLFFADNYIDFAFISITDTAITLEYQNTGNYESLMATAKNMNFFSAKGWDSVNILGAGSYDHTHIPSALTELVQANHWLQADDPLNVVLEGLQEIHKGRTKPGKSLHIIYPYDFYLGRCASPDNSQLLSKLPFDMTNLELELNGVYKIACLTDDDFYNCETEFLELYLFELLRGCPLPSPIPQPPTFVFRESRQNIIGPMELWFNINSGSFSLGSDSQDRTSTSFRPDDLLFRLHNSRYDLAKLHHNSLNTSLQQDLADSVASVYNTEHPAIEKLLNNTLIKLYGLLQIGSPD